MVILGRIEKLTPNLYVDCLTIFNIDSFEKSRIKWELLLVETVLISQERILNLYYVELVKLLNLSNIRI